MFFSQAAEETNLRLTRFVQRSFRVQCLTHSRERIYEIANMRLNGVRQDEIDRQIDDLGLT